MIHPGTQERIFDITATEAGVSRKLGVIESDSLLATLWVTSIDVSATLDIDIYTQTDAGKRVKLFSFPQLTGPSTDLLLRKSGVSMQEFEVVATYTGPVQFEMYIRAITGSGESNTRILGAGNWRVSQETVTTSAAVLIPASLTDRNGLLVKNWDATNTVFIAESLASATIGTGYPLAPRDALAVDLAAGSEVYAVTNAGTADIRIVEVGT